MCARAVQQQAHGAACRLDTSGGSRLTAQLLELLDTCSPDLQRDIIKFLPEVVTDEHHAVRPADRVRVWGGQREDFSRVPFAPALGSHVRRLPGVTAARAGISF